MKMFNFLQNPIQTEIGNLIVSSRIASTSDCQVYSCYNIDGSKYALKTSKLDKYNCSGVSNEPRRYFAIDNDKHKNDFVKRIGTYGKYVKIPKFYCSGMTNGYEYILTTLFGKSLVDFKVSSFEEMKEIALTVLTTFEYIHSRGYVYADVKGGNFVREIDETKGFSVIDLGGIEKFDYNANVNEKIECFRGTHDYASIGAHNNLVLFPRDDLESFGYLIYRWLYGQIPWSNVNIKNHKGFSDQKIAFIEDVGDEKIQRYFDIVFDKKRNDIPDYNALRKLWN